MPTCNQLDLGITIYRQSWVAKRYMPSKELLTSITDPMRNSMGIFCWQSVIVCNIKNLVSTIV